MDKPRLCVDFDGTIFDGFGIIDGCIDKLRSLQQTYVISIFSARATEVERRHMVDVLTQFGVPYDEVLPPKPDAVAFIDDKGIRFDGDWSKVNV